MYETDFCKEKTDRLLFICGMYGILIMDLKIKSLHFQIIEYQGNCEMIKSHILSNF